MPVAVHLEEYMNGYPKKEPSYHHILPAVRLKASWKDSEKATYEEAFWKKSLQLRTNDGSPA